MSRPLFDRIDNLKSPAAGTFGAGVPVLQALDPIPEPILDLAVSVVGCMFQVRSEQYSWQAMGKSPADAMMSTICGPTCVSL